MIDLTTGSWNFAGSLIITDVYGEAFSLSSRVILVECSSAPMATTRWIVGGCWQNFSVNGRNAIANFFPLNVGNNLLIYPTKTSVYGLKIYTKSWTQSVSLNVWEYEEL
ncbi:hypothetical protein [Floridanema evergladense]|uniref:Uncharacterized protein n=1 Tax=Floridaenema evergladense BLCC-F167 TaxID=3153639 RepID=A0ABV4WEG8_9CYAN